MTNQHAPRILIAYPSEFANYAKFERKVATILSNLSEFRLAFCDDNNNLISRCFRSDTRLLEPPFHVEGDQIADVTHAIIFNDGKSFAQLIQTARASGVKLREVITNVTRVVNIDKDDNYDVYIGRGSEWGNPYAIGFDGDRDEVIRKFQYDFQRGFLKFSKTDVLKLRGKTLGCHCKPAACHGDILAEYLNSLED